MAASDTVLGRRGNRVRFLAGQKVRVACFVTWRGQVRYGEHTQSTERKPRTMYRITVRKKPRR